MADMVAKGRKRYFGGRPPKKLSVPQVREIRELLGKGMLQHEVAKLYGIAQATISRTLAREG